MTLEQINEVYEMIKTPEEAAGEIRLLKSDVDRLNRIADLIDIEARSYEDGWTDAKGNWMKDEDWAQVRWIRLPSASRFLRQIAKRKPTAPQ